MRGCGVRYGEGGCAYIVSRDSITGTPGGPFCFVAVRHSMCICISLHICAVGAVFSEEMRRRYRDPQMKECARTIQMLKESGTSQELSKGRPGMWKVKGHARLVDALTLDGGYELKLAQVSP